MPLLIRFLKTKGSVKPEKRGPTLVSFELPGLYVVFEVTLKGFRCFKSLNMVFQSIGPIGPRAVRRWLTHVGTNLVPATNSLMD